MNVINDLSTLNPPPLLDVLHTCVCHTSQCPYMQDGRGRHIRFLKMLKVACSENKLIFVSRAHKD